jgi:AcrR family transcriptional regulator
MDAVEALMREEGYAAVSARSVARRAGLKYQLVFYYFSSMDELLLAAYRRRTATIRARLGEALESPRPLHGFWAVWADPDAALSMEYMALANHNPAIRAETVAFGEDVRRVELPRLTERLRQAAPDPEVFNPFAVTSAIAAVAGVMGLESALGISGGHAETRALVEWCLDRLEP